MQSRGVSAHPEISEVNKDTFSQNESKIIHKSSICACLFSCEENVCFSYTSEVVATHVNSSPTRMYNIHAMFINIQIISQTHTPIMIKLCILPSYK